MTSMADSAIKSGLEIVNEFLETLERNESLDAQTVASIKQLQQTGNLTKVRLLQVLEQMRSGTQKAELSGRFGGQ
jgi:hypothetical protein